MMEKICSSTMDVLEQGSEDENKTTKNNYKSLPSSATVNMEEDDAPAGAVVDVKDCVKRLHTIIDPLPKKVPLIMSVEPDVPLNIVSNDQLIVRACLNLLSNACNKTSHGKIQFRVFQREGQLIFECEDSRANKGLEEADQPTAMDCFDNKCGPKTTLEDEMSPLGLSSLAMQVKTLGGKYGYRSRGLAPSSVDSHGRRKTGAYFWFSVPIELPSQAVLEAMAPQDSGMDSIA